MVNKKEGNWLARVVLYQIDIKKDWFTVTNQFHALHKILHAHLLVVIYLFKMNDSVYAHSRYPWGMKSKNEGTD